MAKKTPKVKGNKNKQLATSFKKQKLTPTGSGKVFKKNRSAKKKGKLAAVSASSLASVSSFNASSLSPSKVSTPVTRSLLAKKRIHSFIDKPSKALKRKAEYSAPSTSQSNSSLEITARSVESPCPAFPTPVPSVGQDQQQLASEGNNIIKASLQDCARSGSTQSTPRKGFPSRKKARLEACPPRGKVVKGDLGDMFRNSHITANDITSVPLDSSACSRAPSLFGEEIIVIDDDEEEEVENNRGEKEKGDCGRTSAVESLGEEMLELMGSNNAEEQESEVVGKYGLAVAKYGLGVLDQRSQCAKASKQPVPATPRTFLKNLDLQHEESGDQWTVVDELGQVDCGSEKCGSTSSEQDSGDGEVTIVIDDTLEEGEAEDNNEVVVERVLNKEAPLTSANMQEVVTRYPNASDDFIPFQSPRQKRAEKAAARAQRKEVQMQRQAVRGRGGVKHPRPAGPRFRMDQPGGFQFNGGGITGQYPGLPRHQLRMAQPGGSGPSFNFGGFSAPRGGVFRFGGGHPGKRAGQPQGLQVSKAPTISEGQGAESRIGLRPIVIDGSNVAMAHGKNKVFSAKGIKIVADHFKKSGHSTVVAFVPQFRSKSGQVADRAVLEGLEEEGVVVFTPSREVDRERITSYDDTFVLDYAAKHGGVVVTRDNYRDLAHSKPEWLEVVKKRILMPTFVGDEVMWPHDPLGRGGLTLDQFLSF